MSKYSSTYTQLAKFGRELLYTKSLLEGLPLISKYIKDIVGADRCSIFIYDADTHELWTTLADEVQRIIVDSDTGIVGETLKIQKPIIENNPYENTHFLPTIDNQTGYKTTSIITVPIFNSLREVQGVLELLNKDGGFNNDDVKFMTFFSHYISGFLELINKNDSE